MRKENIACNIFLKIPPPISLDVNVYVSIDPDLDNYLATITEQISLRHNSIRKSLSELVLILSHHFLTLCNVLCHK